MSGFLTDIHSNGPGERERDAALTGVLLGTALGDALGLPMEGLTAARQQRLFPGPLRHRFIGGRGMVSDDTEHTFLVAQSLLEQADDAGEFQRRLARRLRWWLAALPAGVGSATARAIFKLWLGVSPAKSGVYSAGNGPAMRSAVLGVYFAGDPKRRREFVRASAQITHRDPRAEIAAQAVAEAACWMLEGNDDLPALFANFRALAELPEWQMLVDKLIAAEAAGQTVAEFAQAIGAVRGVSGYAFQSVPVAIYAAMRRRDDFAGALGEAIACGGDTDTVGAMVGAIVGARVGVAGIPEAWRDGTRDWPCSVAVLLRTGERLAQQLVLKRPLGPVRYAWPGTPLRNLAFLAIVLGHGFRRLLPPY